jgi:hypothetical protein
MESNTGAGMRITRRQKPANVNRPKAKQSVNVRKNTAIRLTQAMMDLHILDVDISEETENPASFDGKRFLNGEDYDFSEYDLDSPLADEDALDFLSMDNSINILESDQYPSYLNPVPNVIIDELGNVTIPAELRLIEEEKSSPDQQDKWFACQKLRQVMETLVHQTRHVLLNPEKLPANLPSLTQGDFIENISIADLDVALMSRIADRYVKTPFWGVLHLTEFFQGQKKKAGIWQDVTEKIRKDIENESPDNPTKTKFLWNKYKAGIQDLVTEDASDDKTFRTFRNHLSAAGIPLETPRKEIFAKVQQWAKDTGKARINKSELHAVRQELFDNYGLFQTKKTQICQDVQYQPFVENRIAQVLRKINVEVTDD